MIDLKFLGTGSAFNTSLGNTSAYLKSENEKSLLLLDCGSSTFKEIMDKEILKDVDGIYVAITHLHPDHVGSLGDLIFYSFYTLQKKITLLYPESNITNLLYSLGVDRELYNLYRLTPYVTTTIKDVNFEEGIKITPTYASHAVGMACYSYLLEDTDDNLFYSGDSNLITEGVKTSLEKGELNRLYQDTCGQDYEGNVHLSLDKLAESIREDLRHKVYCIHLDGSFDVEKAKKLGFNIV